jgi:hypothetical protein
VSDGERELTEELYRELVATEDLPLERRANQWIGEAQAVADTIRDAPDEARRKGANDIVRLLESIDDTGDERADEHIERAHEIAERVAQT